MITYHLLDVFTDRMFGGNPLAVFPDADGLDHLLMQRLAAELGLSESVFVSRPDGDDVDYRIRIFTPSMELPFAGHPTVGAAILLVRLAFSPTSDSGVMLRLRERVGVVNVNVKTRPHGMYAELHVPGTPRVGPTPPSRQELSGLLGLSEGELAASADDPCAVSAGVPFLVIPVRDPAALAKVRLDSSRWTALLAGFWAPHVYVVCHGTTRDVRARMFAPLMSIPEDPATGAAVAALPAYLVRRFALRDDTYEWTVSQGVEMGRPSTLNLRFDVQQGAAENVRLGGAAVHVGEGRLFLGGQTLD